MGWKTLRLSKNLPRSFKKLVEGEVVNNILDIYRLPEEVLLILELLKEKDEVQKLECLERLSKDVDWQLFLDYAIHHRVYPTLFGQLKQLKNQLEVPTFVIQSLEQLYKKNTFEMLQLSAEMNEIGKFFAEHEIEALFLKGPAIAHDLFGDISLRTSKDLDILIPIHQIENAKRILEQLGYVQTKFIRSLFNEWKWRQKDISFYHPEKQIEIEIHWRLSCGPEKEPSFMELWARRRKSIITQDPCYILGREDLFYYLVHHGARHAWFRLRWLVDIQQIVNLQLDWLTIYQLFKKNNYVHLSGQAIILASQLLEMNVTSEMVPFLKKRKAYKIANNTLYFLDGIKDIYAPELTNYYLNYVRTIKTNLQRLIKDISRLHPISKDAEDLPLPKQLHFLYFLLRPFLWFIRKRKIVVFSKDEFQ